MESQIRTDLALEKRELCGQAEGVVQRQTQQDGFVVETVEVVSEAGAQALGKPQGVYHTVLLDGLLRREDGAFSRGAGVLAGLLRALLRLGERDSVLVVGLGNADITPDRLGPDAVRHTLVTRHLVDSLPEQFGGFRRVSAVRAGVLGTTGIESAELVRALVERIRPDAVVAVDALASRKMARVCRTVQLCDTGISPGSGVGNHRAELSRATLGVPVVALGVPTVVDARTLALDLIQEAGLPAPPPDALTEGESMIVTPRDIDASIAGIAKLLGYAIDLALHEGLTVEDIDMLQP